MIVGISAVTSGKQSGKDTFAKLASNKLKQHGIAVSTMHLAWPLKEACRILFGAPVAEETKDSLSGWDWPENNDEGRTGRMTNREIWQFFGTNIMRNQWHYDIWVMITKKHIEDMRKNSPDQIFFIPDIRFPNEAEHLDMLVDIYREEALQRNLAKSPGTFSHSSEQSGKLIPEERFTLKVDNNSTISELDKQAEEFVIGKLLPAISNKRSLL